MVADALQAAGHEAVIVDPLALRLPLLERTYSEFEEGSARPAWTSWRRCIAVPTASSLSAANTTTAFRQP